LKDMACIILAAGRGTRMNSKVPKPLLEVHSRPMLQYLIDSVKDAGISKTVLVLGYGASEIKKKFSNFDIVHQSRLLGSGDAVRSTKKYFDNYNGDILIICSDTPLIKSVTLKKLIATHREKNCGATILTTVLNDPEGYGRILRDSEGNIARIVEDKDATKYEEIINEINVGAYCFEKQALFSNINKIKMNKKKNEYYLTDIIEHLNKSNTKVGFFTTEDTAECMGINSRISLVNANRIVKKRILKDLMEDGVSIVDVDSTFIDFEVKIGIDTIVYPHTIIEKDVEIGKDCKIGPYAHIRSGTRISKGVEVGNFVELVRTKVGSGCKIKHKTYLGDAVLGKDINIGAGTITANYDGKNKNKTVIKDNAFIGVGSILIAPVTIGKNAVVGAGSVVTKKHDVGDGETVVGIPARSLKKKRRLR